MIIVTTFVLEVALKGRERELVSLLIVLRLWRLVKLVGGTTLFPYVCYGQNSLVIQGIAVGAGEIGEEVAKELDRTCKELDQVRAELSQVRYENEALKQKLDALQGSS